MRGLPRRGNDRSRHDREDSERRISCPVLILWSAEGLDSFYNVLEIWREETATVEGRALECGHFLAEESPEALLSELVRFLAAEPASEL